MFFESVKFDRRKLNINIKMMSQHVTRLCLVFFKNRGKEKRKNKGRKVGEKKHKKLKF